MALSKVAARQADSLSAADSLGLSARARRRLEAAQAWQIFAHRYASDIAHRLNLSEDLVHDWGNVERGRRGPHWQLAEIVECAMDEGMPRRRALSLLDWLESLFGRVAHDLPPAGEPVTLRDLPSGIREFGQSLEALTEHVEEGDDRPADQVRGELLDVLDWIHQILARLDHAERRGAR
ncbi:MAG: hypothetical protein KJ058_13740 [Thermoanaerobaculia bacterium]|nr:hypothetical protein [Thermoanaerobaculia bacterium]